MPKMQNIDLPKFTKDIYERISEELKNPFKNAEYSGKT